MIFYLLSIKYDQKTNNYNININKNKQEKHKILYNFIG